MSGGCVHYLRSDNMDLLCMFRNHVLPPTYSFMDLQCIIGSRDIVIIMDLQVYWSIAMIKSDKSASVMSSSLIASILD